MACYVCIYKSNTKYFHVLYTKRQVAEMTIHDAQSELRYPPKMTWTAVAVEIGIIAFAIVIFVAAAG